jgi:hypothetical protein
MVALVVLAFALMVLVGASGLFEQGRLNTGSHLVRRAIGRAAERIKADFTEATAEARAAVAEATAEAAAAVAGAGRSAEEWLQQRGGGVGDLEFADRSRPPR